MRFKRKINKNNEDKDNGKNSIKSALADEDGNFSIIMSSLLLIGFLLLSIIVLNIAIEEKNESHEIISSNNYQYVMNDYIRNLPILERESLEELSEEVMNNQRPCLDSKSNLKEIVDGKLSDYNQQYYDNYNIQINSSLIAIENTSNPFSYKFKTYVRSVKGDYSFENIASSDVDCIGLRDPVPLLYCKSYHGLSLNDTDYNYGDSLSEFLKSNDVENYSFYVNASSPLIIRKCPYDPYVHHGDPGVLDDCMKKGYFHESADGSCYL